MAVLVLVLCGTAFAAQAPGRYRGFELGSDVATVSAAAGSGGSDVRVIHQRPALIQELTWKPTYGARRPAAPDIESVEQVVFAFYENRLFRMTVDYDPARTAGLRDADMIEAISAIYGAPLQPSVARKPPAGSVYDDPGTLVAQWGTVDDSILLYRPSSYTTRFRMLVTAEPTAALARAAAARALVLDAREAPQREAARTKKEAEDRRAAEEKTRSTNKAIFRP